MIGETHAGRRCEAIGWKINDRSTKALILAAAQRDDLEKNTNSPYPSKGQTRRLHPSLVQFDRIDPGGRGRQRRN